MRIAYERVKGKGKEISYEVIAIISVRGNDILAQNGSNRAKEKWSGFV